MQFKVYEIPRTGSSFLICEIYRRLFIAFGKMQPYQKYCELIFCAYCLYCLFISIVSSNLCMLPGFGGTMQNSECFHIRAEQFSTQNLTALICAVAKNPHCFCTFVAVEMAVIAQYPPGLSLMYFFTASQL